MTSIEQYEFDRLGYLVLKNLLAPVEVSALSQAINATEEHAPSQLSPGQNNMFRAWPI